MSLPDADTIHVYLWNYQQFDDREYATFQKTLSPTEVERNLKYSQPIHRRRDAICRGLLRRHLGRLLQKPAQHIPLVANKNGKPQLENRKDSFLQFNYSHSGDFAAFAFCQEAEIGVDIEFTPRNNNVSGIAEHFFAPAEVAALRALPEARQRQRFFEYWTLKEAYIKARGEGIFLGLDKFSFEPDLNEEHCDDLSGAQKNNEDIKIYFVSEEFDTPQQWQFYCLAPLGDYQVSVAVRDARRKSLILHAPQNPAFSATHAV